MTQAQIPTGRVALVTGAGRGLGRSIAQALAESGVIVAAASRSEAEIQGFVAEQEASGRVALAVPMDVTREVSVQAAIEITIEMYGKIDILVNNSGVLASGPLVDSDLSEWQRVIDTNLTGVFLTTKAVGPHMIKAGKGKVINIASNFALQGVANHAAYSASKAGVIAFTRSVAIEWARYNIQVNAIAPGYFETQLNEALRADADSISRVIKAIPARRIGSPDEIAPWVKLLAGPASDFMTGEVIVLDGGQSVR